MTRGGRLRTAATAAAVLTSCFAAPQAMAQAKAQAEVQTMAQATAQAGPIGPCSPYRASDGDIPSEMPGCTRRARPAPGSLADELQFRRRREPAEADDGAPDDGDAAPRRRARRPAERAKPR